ncbi:MAG: hypothetical protein ACOC0N_03390 [Chroococcales cyanobacterium]
MKTTTYPINLDTLQTVLHQRLQSELLPTTPLKVSCVLRNQTLVIVLEHPSPPRRHTKRMFRFVLQTLQEEKLLKSPYQIILYLKVMTDPRPYAFHRFSPPSPKAKASAPSPLLQDKTAETPTKESSAARTGNAAVLPESPSFGENSASPESTLQGRTENVELAEMAPPPSDINESEDLLSIPESKLIQSFAEVSTVSVATPPPEIDESEDLLSIPESELEQPSQQSFPPVISESNEVLRELDWEAMAEDDSVVEEVFGDSLILEDDADEASETLLEETETEFPEQLTLETIELELEVENVEDEAAWEDSSSGGGFVTDEDSLEETEEEFQPNKSAQPKSWLPLMVAGAGVSFVVLCTSLYVLTRPCVIGECQAIPEAKELAIDSEKILVEPKSGQEILQAQAQLKEAINQLGAIPWWSKYHQQAQPILEQYQTRAVSLEEVVSALKLAAKASYMSQNPPLTEAQWLEIQKLWRDSISRLEQLPSENEFYSFAQEKVRAYQTNLATINYRLNTEKQSQQSLAAAKEAAKLAEVRQSAAHSLQNWVLAYSTWETAIARLQEIPEGTTAYSEAQELLVVYKAKFAEVRDRKNQETFSNSVYNQGLSLAELAKKAESTNQWSQSVFHWQNALNYLQQVPRNTFRYPTAQGLINPYTDSLNQAEEQLRLELKRKQASNDLAQACLETTQVCSHTITDNTIQVRLTPGYMQEVRQTAIEAKVNGDTNTQTNLYNHLLTLDDALKTISNNSGLRLEVYTPEGSLIETHVPKS